MQGKQEQKMHKYVNACSHSGKSLIEVITSLFPYKSIKLF